MENNNTAATQRKPLSFGQTMLASSIGVLIAGAILSLLSFLLTVVMIASMIGGLSAESSSTTKVKDCTFVHIDLRQPVQEAASSALEMAFAQEKMTSAETILKCIDDAKNDSKVNGLYVTVGGISGLTWGLTEELRNALIDFRETGKSIVFYGEHYSQAEYYLATAAPFISLHPDGSVDFRGIGSQVMYYKDLFDKLGVKVDLIRPTSCAYKSAGETYTMNHMSDANREQIHAYINSIWDYVSFNIAGSNRLDLEHVNEVADNLTGYLGKEAFAVGMIDTLCFADDLKAYMKGSLGCRNILSMNKYVKAHPAATNGAKIAVIYAEGNVQAGAYPGYGSGIYTDPMVKAINKAVDDNDVKAIVLRVNSRGGAATTSQSITNAIRKAKEQKPVVVSMSDYAASAGYEISCLANCIVAQPTTITGSIGVFGTLPEIGTMLKKKIGITFDTAQTNANAAGLSLVAPLSPTARAMMQRNVEDFYVTFVSTVAAGRGLDYDYVHSIARGRVWTGIDAHKLGLVDTLGGLKDAIAIAADLAGIANSYHAVRYPAQEELMVQLQHLFGNSSDDDDDELSLSFVQKMQALFTIKQARKSPAATYEQRIKQDLLSLTDEPTLQARLPFLIVEE